MRTSVPSKSSLPIRLITVHCSILHQLSNDTVVYLFSTRRTVIVLQLYFPRYTLKIIFSFRDFQQIKISIWYGNILTICPTS